MLLTKPHTSPTTPKYELKTMAVASPEPWESKAFGGSSLPLAYELWVPWWLELFQAWPWIQHPTHSRHSKQVYRKEWFFWGKPSPASKVSNSMQMEASHISRVMTQGVVPVPAAACTELWFMGFYSPVFRCSLTVYCSAANKHCVINDKQGSLWGMREPCLKSFAAL